MGIERTLSNKPLTKDDFLEALNREVIPVLRELRDAVNAMPVLRNGSGAPAASLGDDDDWYCDTSTGTVYVKISGSWT